MVHPLIERLAIKKSEISYNLNFDGSKEKIIKTPIIDVFDEVYSFNHVVYLSPKQPIVHRYCCTSLMKFEIKRNKLLISRRIEDSTIASSVRICMLSRRMNSRYSIDTLLETIDFVIFNSCERAEYSEKWQTVEKILENESYRYARLHIQMVGALSGLRKPKNIPRWNGNGYTQLKCNGGIIRVHKKTLSDELEYFKQLFDNNKHQSYYHINVDFTDMMEVIFTLNPINKPIKNGLTYGAIYRVSQELKCIKLAAMCENFIEKIKQRRPLDASFLAFEGGIECESKLFLAAKQSGIRLEQQFRNQRGRGSREVIKEYSHREL